MDWKKNIEVLTPLFNRGAYQNTPEVRVPSIRGMVRWWFRKLGGSPCEEKEAFGGMASMGPTKDKEMKASRLVFRVTQLQACVAHSFLATLPHKTGGQASPKAAFEPGVRFNLAVFSRFGSMSPSLEEKVTKALEVWQLLGSLGLRANRAAGSVWPAENAPEGAAALRQQLVGYGCNWPVMLVGKEAGRDVEQLRAAATDTVSGSPAIFGKVKGGREASPLKFKVVRLEGSYRLIVFAENQQIIDDAMRLLASHRSRPETWAPLAPP